jgi:OFA family oxalate/formate antiporter-like MFS transporter
LSEALKTWQWWALWLLLFVNTYAGISIISQEAPLFQELTKVSAVVAASMVGLASIGNAVGRVFWAWISDLITRRATFFVMFVAQVLLFWFFPNIVTASLMTIVTFVVLMCYGGGFGTMPAFAADYFGPKNVGPIYGLMLTAWGFASAFGPLLIAHMRESRIVSWRASCHRWCHGDFSSVADGCASAADWRHRRRQNVTVSGQTSTASVSRTSRRYTF